MARAAKFSWDDPLQLDAQLSADERAVRDAASAYCQEREWAGRIDGETDRCRKPI